MSVFPGILASKKKPKAGLLRVASLLPSGDWRTGVQYVPEGCFSPDAVPICDLGFDKPRITPQGAVSFQPFGIVANDGCNDPWALEGEQEARASRVLDMGQSSILARELLLSTVAGNPDLSTTAVDLTALMAPPAAVPWLEAATALIWNMKEAGYVGDIVIHAPSFLLPSFNASQIGHTDPATGMSFIGSHQVVFDAGYSGAISPGEVGLAADPPRSGWVYATGPIEYAFAEEMETRSGDPRKNDKYAVAERPGIVRFDPCQVFGILVKVC